MTIAETLTDPIAQKATTVIAAGAAATPWWLPVLKEFSSIAADLLPIAGLVWLLIQIGYRIFGKEKKR